MITGWEAYVATFFWWLIVVGALSLLVVAGYQMFEDWWDGRQSTETDEQLEMLLDRWEKEQ